MRLVLAALVLAGGFQVAADAWLHTDDGCVVETHCLACQSHLGTTVVPTVAPATQAPTDFGFVEPVDTPEPFLSAPSLQVSPRGPPLT